MAEGTWLNAKISVIHVARATEHQHSRPSGVVKRPFWLEVASDLIPPSIGPEGARYSEAPQGRAANLWVADTEVAMADYATLLRDHTTLKVRSIDRIFLQAYVPKLQSVGQVCIFLRWHRNVHIPSSAAFGQIGDRYVKEIERFAKQQGIPIIHFEKGENKEQRARALLEKAAGEAGEGRVVLIGIAQEKASVWRSWKAKGQQNVAPPPGGQDS
jgi:hypothetical protein